MFQIATNPFPNKNSFQVLQITNSKLLFLVNKHDKSYLFDLDKEQFSETDIPDIISSAQKIELGNQQILLYWRNKPAAIKLWDVKNNEIKDICLAPNQIGKISEHASYVVDDICHIVFNNSDSGADAGFGWNSNYYLYCRYDIQRGILSNYVTLDIKYLPLRDLVQQALNRIKRFCQHIRVSVLSDMFSHISSGPEADQCHSIWERLTYELSTDAILRRAEETQDHSTLVEYIDDMVLLPAGTFYQGGPQISSSAERPRHQVKISNSFWVGQTAVTHRLWETVMGDGKGRDSGLEPKAEVSWFEALHFCNRLSEQSQLEPVYKIEDHQLPRVIYKTSSSGFRLLTESEWEYACLGGQRTSLTAPPFSPIPAWTQQRSQLKVHPVAQLFPNQWGLYDCLGNVAEWCQDEYHAHAYQERRRLTSDPCEYHSDGGERVIRGGAFDSVEYLVTPSRRDACRPQKRWSSIGFRAARSHQSK